MSQRQEMRRLEREVRALPADEPAPPVFDADQLAREAVAAYVTELKRYARIRATDPERPNPAERPADWEEKSLRNAAAETLTFWDLERLGRIDPALATARWEEAKAVAAADLDRGWLAGRALQFAGMDVSSDARTRACFLALRDRLRQAWRPRNAGESLLIDEMAQYELVRQWWLGVFAMSSCEPATLTRRRAAGDSELGSQNMADATEQASRMLERTQRLYQNAVRLLMSLRRRKPQVVFQKLGQVNVGVGQQVNVGGATGEDGSA